MPYYRGVYFKELPFDVVNEKMAAKMAAQDSLKDTRVGSVDPAGSGELEISADLGGSSLEDSIDTLDYSKVVPSSDDDTPADEVPAPSLKKSKKKTKL